MTHAGTDKRGQLLAKYMFDKLIAATMLLALSPFFLLIAIAIKLDDRGPVFFRQERLGVDGSLFRIWKFRTLIVDADRLLEPDGSVKVDRSTRVGRVLRFLSLDELPQLLNILKGDMSIVGPRPALPEHLQRYTCAQRGRLAMRPGVTGLAQINGRNTLKWSRRIEYDLEYIRTFSLLQDLMILIKTVKVVLLREGVAADRNPEQVDDLASPRR
jgi:undecaprenyl phosphate N,N'-diacetylbacillosamine 1-phosphate transferase